MKSLTQYNLRYGLKIGGMSVSSGPAENDGRSSKFTVNMAEDSPHDAAAVGVADITAVDALVNSTVCVIGWVGEVGENAEIVGTGCKPGWREVHVLMRVVVERIDDGLGVGFKSHG